MGGIGMSIILTIFGFFRGLSPKTMLILGAGVAIVAGLCYFHHETIKNEDARITVATDNHLNKIKGKQDEIRNSGLTGHDIAVRMRAGVF